MASVEVGPDLCAQRTEREESARRTENSKGQDSLRIKHAGQKALFFLNQDIPIYMATYSGCKRSNPVLISRVFKNRNMSIFGLLQAFTWMSAIGLLLIFQ